MTANEQNIAAFESRVRQLILRFQQLKKENHELSLQVAAGKKALDVLRVQLDQKQSDYDSLKMAKMLEITDGDLSGAKARISKLIRDVNKCIAILSDEHP